MAMRTRRTRRLRSCQVQLSKRLRKRFDFKSFCISLCQLSKRARRELQESSYKREERKQRHKKDVQQSFLDLDDFEDSTEVQNSSVNM